VMRANPQYLRISAKYRVPARKKPHILWQNRVFMVTKPDTRGMCGIDKATKTPANAGKSAQW